MLVKKKKFPKSIRKYIRRKKSEIRKEVLDIEEQKQKIDNLSKRFLKKIKNS